jgi:hypothetical protein
MGQLAVGIAKMETLEPKTTTKTKTGIAFPRYFTSRLEPGKTPYDEIPWELRTASIGNDKGSVIFEQRDIEVPPDWSQTATNIVASKYFYGKPGSPDRETSVAQLVERVVNTIADWGKITESFQFVNRDAEENSMGQLAMDIAKMEALEPKTTTKTKTGIAFPRYFTARLEPGRTPYDEIPWETRTLDWKR